MPGVRALGKAMSSSELPRIPKSFRSISSYTVVVVYKGQFWAHKGRGYKGRLREFCQT